MKYHRSVICNDLVQTLLGFQIGGGLSKLPFFAPWSGVMPPLSSGHATVSAGQLTGLLTVISLIGSVLAPSQCPPLDSAGNSLHVGFVGSPAAIGVHSSLPPSLRSRSTLPFHSQRLGVHVHPENSCCLRSTPLTSSASSSRSGTTLRMSVMSELFAMGERLLKGKDERKGVIVR